MNIALPALLVFALLLPGFVFRSRLKLVERTSLDFSPFGQVVTEAVLAATALHLLWLLASYCLLGNTLKTEVLFRLASADPVSQTAAIAEIGRHELKISGYFVSLLAFSYVVPALLRKVVTRWKLDRHDAAFSSLLRFHGAPWYYLLTGADFKRDEEPDLISVSAIVDTGAESTLYTGFLDDFIVRPDGDLDRLVLSGVTRRPLTRDRENPEDAAPERFYPVEGDYFVLRASEMITLNIRYVSLPDAAPPNGPA